MKIGIISDSHDHLVNIEKSVKVFQDRNVEYVIHLGDFINPNSVMAFRGIKLIGIFGNNDGDKMRLLAAFQEINGEPKGDFHEFETGGLRFACYHGTEPQIKDALIACQKYDVFLFGHTHTYVNETIGKTLVLNPGTAHGFREEATVIVFDTEKRHTELIVL